MNDRRIATVLRVRELQERIARSEVARRQVALAQERDAEAAAWQHVRRRSAEAPPAALHFLGHRAMLHGGVADAHRARHRVDTAHEQVRSSLDVWQVEAQRLDGMERLAERVRGEAAAEAERRTANEMDDLVVMRHRSEP